MPAPVFPAVTKASASPFFTRSIPTAIEFFESLARAFNTRASPLSSMVNISGAWTMRIFNPCVFCCSNTGLICAS
ncbi:MAG TPA: hypothetical protein PKD25_04475, partial [Rubrivivax sp.]|nr:hypothetical protein [Rubrivivax sp.]